MLRTIYALRDPRDRSVRYVGATAHMKGRWKVHFYQGPMEAKQVAKAAWVLFLRTIGQRPIMEVLEEVDAESWKDRERFWIKFLEPIYNIQPGGTGKGHRKSAETRRKMSDAQKGRPKKWTPDAAERVRHGADKGRKSFWGGMTAEERSEFSKRATASYWAKFTPEERSQMARERNEKRWAKVRGDRGDDGHGGAGDD